MPQIPLGACALQHQENIHVRCFQKYVRYFTKQLKTLTVNICERGNGKMSREK